MLFWLLETLFRRILGTGGRAGLERDVEVPGGATSSLRLTRPGRKGRCSARRRQNGSYTPSSPTAQHEMNTQKGPAPEDAE
jgi:hypothetical protein